MSWLAQRRLGTVLVGLTVLPLVLSTVIIALTAIHTTRPWRAELVASAPAALRGELAVLLDREAGRTTQRDAQLTGGLIVLGFVAALLATRRVRARVDELRRAAERLSRGELEQPVHEPGGDELGVLAGALDRMRVDLRRAAELAAEKAALERDMALTAELQARFLPDALDASTGRLELAAHYSPAVRCGGDWWWSEPREDGGALVLMGDVTGHGAGSALVTAAVATALDCARARGLGQDVPALLHTVGACLRDIAGDAYHMTVSALLVDPSRATLRWWSAGAPPIMSLGADGELRTWTAKGAPLGRADQALGEQTLPFAVGDTAFLFTDGISELKRDNGRELGLRRLACLLRDSGGDTARAGRDTLARELDELVDQAGEQDDDITFVLLKRTA